MDGNCIDGNPFMVTLNWKCSQNRYKKTLKKETSQYTDSHIVEHFKYSAVTIRKEQDSLIYFLFNQ